MGKKPGIVASAAELLEIPAEVMRGVPKLTITGCRRALVENHRGILKYSNDLIEIGGGSVRLRIRGDGLELLAMNRAELVISGQIFAAEFE